MTPSPPSPPVHAPMEQFPVVDGCLWVGGLPLPRLAQQVGQTPFYAYDRRLIAERVAALRRLLPHAVRLHYAVKANPHCDVIRHLDGLVDGLDIASGGELARVLEIGANPETVSFAGPGKRPVELAAALAAGVTINLESEGELATVARLAADSGRVAKVAVRVNPDFELKGAGMRMGGGPKPFGVDAEAVPSLLARVTALGLAFQGFHIYAGSQNLNPEAIVAAQSQSVELALRLASHAPYPPRHINIGGGLGIPYFPGEKPLDLAPVAANLDLLQERLSQALPGAYLVLELGRYLVGEAGLYVTEVVDRKVSRGQVFLVVDGGLHHHLAASGNFGQVLRRNYPVAVGNRMGQTPLEMVSVVGPSCTPLDLLAHRVVLPRAGVGDFIVVYQSGAYGLTASPQGFLSHPAAGEIVV